MGVFLKNKKGKLARDLQHAIYFVVIFLLIAFVLNLIPALLYFFTTISENTLNFMSIAALSLSFLISPIIYLRVVDKNKKSIVDKLGLRINDQTPKNLLLGVYIFAIILVLEIIVGLISNITNIQISTNVANVFAGAPLWFIFFATFIAPIDEEVLFRGLMVPRVGIAVAALLFALPHYTYGSTFEIEVIAALIFGLIAGYAYKKTGSLYPSLTAHILINGFTLLSTFSMLLWVH